jgi:glycosyltransferase involved in cell wall biosynthesis
VTANPAQPGRTQSSLANSTPGADGRGAMRIGIHDFSGHPFQVQLSRELASRGHEVVHWHCPSYVTGKGAVESSAADPPTFRLQPIPLTRAFSKYSMRRRLQQERAYGRALSAAAAAFAPDVLVSSNNPLLSQQVLLRTCERLGLPFVFWQQDIYSVAMARVAKSRYPLLGSMMGRYLLRLEASMLRRSAKVVAISEDFLPVLRSWGVHDENVVVIENWAPLDDLPMAPRDNAWARERELVGSRVFLYSGTLGVKHNPEMLVELAEQYRGTDTRVVVLSEGLGADFLRRASAQRGLDNLAVLPFQPFQQLPMVFASADVLVAILDAPAGSYSVPSKVLSYHCAGRPILAALPQDNLAARVVDRAKSGIVVDPSSTVAFVSGARRLLEDEELRLRCGENARTFAETAFDIDQIADRFEAIFAELVPAAGTRNRASQGGGT